MSLDPAAIIVQAEAALAKIKRDPIAAFRFSSDGQRNFAKALSLFRETALRSGIQYGKAQPVDELVATPTGWRTIGSLRVGEKVFAGDGTVTTVRGVFPQGVLSVYRVTFNDGSSTRCCSEHLWRVKTRAHRYKGVRGTEVMSLWEIVAHCGTHPKPGNAVTIPTSGAVDYPHSDQPLAPYTLGALLGDGCFQSTGVALSSADEPVLSRVRDEIGGMGLRRTTEDGCDYRFTTGSRGGDVSVRPKNTVLHAIRGLGLDCLHAHEKFIPSCYLVASKTQRLALLQGLMDTDGWAEKSGLSLFTTTSPRLRDGFVELVRSLGGKAVVWKEKRNWYAHNGERKQGRPSWTVRVRLPGERIFHLDRKQSRIIDANRTMDRVLMSVEAAGSEQCVCIMVDHPGRTYLTKDFIVTHNTTMGAYCGVAMMRGCAEIDGVKLPVLGTPNVGVILAKGRAMAKESVIKKYLEAIGDWPHHVERQGNSIEAIWVKPNRSKSDEWRDWSVVRIFVEAGQSVAGMRLDWAHADEPPDWDMWSELRGRAKANRLFVRFITFTPIDKREWLPVRADFKGCSWPKGKDGKVEIVGSVFDNKALGPEHRKWLENETKGPLQRAKLYGEYVDTTGSNPFDAAGLKRWRERCIDPFKVHTWHTTSGRPIEWEAWGVPVEGEQYLVVADPSAGIEDEAGAHDPCEVVVVSRGVKGRPAVVARYNGYIPAYELGRLSTYLAETFNRALLVFERNSGYGEAFFLGVGKYGNLYIEYHLDSRHLPLSERVGWTTTATSRGAVIGALQKAILEDGLWLLSEKAVESLENVVVKRDGIRVEAGAGAHDEDMIVLGIACHILGTYPVYAATEEKTDGEKWLEQHGFTDEKMGRHHDPFAAF